MDQVLVMPGYCHHPDWLPARRPNAEAANIVALRSRPGWSSTSNRVQDRDRIVGQLAHRVGIGVEGPR
jgi:hypothetical protein